MSNASKYIRVNATLYKRVDDHLVNLEAGQLLDAWKRSAEYTKFLPTVVDTYLRRDDWEGLAERLREKFSMWVSEQVLAPIEDSIDWYNEADELARRR